MADLDLTSLERDLAARPDSAAASPPGGPGRAAVPARHEVSPLPLDLGDPVDVHRVLLRLSLRAEDGAAGVVRSEVSGDDGGLECVAPTAPVAGEVELVFRTVDRLGHVESAQRVDLPGWGQEAVGTPEVAAVVSRTAPDASSAGSGASWALLVVTLSVGAAAAGLVLRKRRS